ncbi:unnamed protein product [Coregonus sp. 'balchen']|nr:unnamed protein product [Coregonus sp. 'balchen']
MSSNEVQQENGQPLDTESEVQDTPAPPAIPFYTECSEAAQAELLNECEEQFAQLQMLQNEIILAEPDSDENPQEQLQKLNSQLELVLSCSQAKRDTLRETLKSEQKWLEEKKEVLRAGTEHVDTKKKIQKMKDYQDRLMETLADVLEEHFPLPTQETNANKKKKLLMNKTLETPHDPYILIDETFWPPYTEMLLRYGIALRHPEDCFKIRLETFY